jgi:biotin-dependent carboxylase-like uncharacterized protein
MSLEVLAPGWASYVVDSGRPGWRSLGVPIGGAADVRSLAAGNALVGNSPDAAALEVCLSGPHLRALVDVACVVFGAPFELTGSHPQHRTGTTFTLHAGQELRIGGTREGMRAYLCVRGGLQVPQILGSRSALAPLRNGEILPCPSGRIHGRFARDIAPRFADRYTLRVLPGLQASWFRTEEFYGQEFTVSHAINRMGLRLQGEPLTMPERELVSEPVAPGAVQVTRDGRCIVLGVDGQTIGGYPKVAHIIRADLDRLGQLRPGDHVQFVQVAMEEALAVFRQQHAEMQKTLLRLRLSLG